MLIVPAALLLFAGLVVDQPMAQRLRYDASVYVHHRADRPGRLHHGAEDAGDDPTGLRSVRR